MLHRHWNSIGNHGRRRLCFGRVFQSYQWYNHRYLHRHYVVSIRTNNVIFISVVRPRPIMKVLKFETPNEKSSIVGKFYFNNLL